MNHRSISISNLRRHQPSPGGGRSELSQPGSSHSPSIVPCVSQWLQLLDLLLVAFAGYRLGWILRGYRKRMIEIKAEPKAALDVELVGENYNIHPPKASLALKLAVRAKTNADDPGLLLKTIDEWIDVAFGKAGAKAIHKRLDDPNDVLDIEHIMKLMEAVIEETSGNPTT